MKKTWKKSLLTGLSVGILALGTVGCGDSDNFVFTDAVAVATTSDVSFQLVVDQIIAGGFDGSGDFVFTDAAGETVFEADGINVDTIAVLNDVPEEATNVSITLRDAAGAPLSTVTAPLELIGGLDTTVDLTGATETPITFDSLAIAPDPLLLDRNQPAEGVQVLLNGAFGNGEEVAFPLETLSTSATFGSSDIAVFEVDASGLTLPCINEATLSEATLTSTFTVGDVTQSDDVEVRIGEIQVFAQSFPSPGGTSSPLQVLFADGNGPFNRVDGDSGLSFAIDPPVEGVTVDAADGSFTVDSTVAAGTSVTVNVSFDSTELGDGVGREYIDSIELPVQSSDDRIILDVALER